MTTNTDRDTLKALTVLFKSSQHVQDNLKKDMTQHGLNLSEFAVLELLYHKGEQPIQNIGKKILLASSSLTYVVDKLENKGLVQRIPCATDRRVIFPAITDNGRELMDQIFPLHAAQIEEIFSVLSDKEVETFIDLVKRVGVHAESLQH
jgi:MarR family transcriptional regulator, 2-MHQ and catechol-resistance regulon repressor